MIIRKYGLELHRLTENDIELVRQARNRDDIRLKMFDQHIITSEEQKNWFQSIDNMHHYYFLIHHNNKKIGIIYGKNIDWKKRESEGGMFIWDTDPQTSIIAAKASILLMEFSYELIKMEKTYIKIKKDNTQAMSYNKALGYLKAEAPEWLYLDKANYTKNITHLRKLASGKKTSTPLTIHDVEFPNLERYMYLYKNLPKDLFTTFGRDDT